MARRPPDRSRQRGLTVVRILGLVLVAAGMALLLLPDLDKNLRPVGAGGVLLGVLVLGSHALRQLKAQLMADGPLKEPDFHKPAHGASNFGSSTAPRLARLSAERPAPPLDPRVSLLDPSIQLASSAVPAALPSPPTAWGPEVFEAMSAQQFENVCEALFVQGGFGTTCQSHGAAGGVTVWLHSRHAQQGKNSPVAVALCRQWRGHPVGVREMHPLLELMQARQLKRGTYATSSSYTDNARKFARYNGINALDRTGLLALIAARSAAQQQALLALALGKL